MSGFAWFACGFGVGAISLLALSLFTKKKVEVIEEVEVPVKPDQILNEQEKERVREEIARDSNAELARRFLSQLPGRRDRNR